ADAASPAAESTAPAHFLRAIWFIVVADITMSVDNVLAIAGASRGSVPLIVLGLGLSIPFVMFSSNLLVLLMDRYPWTLHRRSAIPRTTRAHHRAHAARCAGGPRRLLPGARRPRDPAAFQ